MHDFKALMLDVDGTIVNYAIESLPTKKVKDALVEAERRIKICLVTGREYKVLKPITDFLTIKGYAICHGGAQLIDLASEKTLWEQCLNPDDTRGVIELLEKENIPVYMTSDQLVSSKTIPEKAHNLFTGPMSLTEAKKLRKKLQHFSRLSCHVITFWSAERFCVAINHVEATKQHGIIEVGKRLGISPSEMIGIGDSYNDYPLLMACGLKIAMGNALPALKEIADYIAPSVEEDGVAWAIEKFVLHKATIS